MRRFLAFLLSLVALVALAAPAHAQLGYVPVPSVSSVVLGTFTIGTMPACDLTTRGKYAFVTDLGGGADTVICDGLYWKHIRLGAPTSVTQASGTYIVTPLVTPQILFLTGSILTSLTVQIGTGNLYPGYMLYVRRPGLLTGTINVQMASGGPLYSVLGNQTAIFVYDGAALQQVQ